MGLCCMSFLSSSCGGKRTNAIQNLDEFKSQSCWTPFAYGYLWVMLFVSISVYCVDTFTAINLLVFDKWAGQIKPTIPLRISRWIFAGCIILSFLLLIYRWIRAVRVIKQGGVARSYLDPLAVRLQSIRTGKQGRGWRRFLVFAELTKSRKGADYVALFSYFSFEAWLRICFAEAPRQVLNAITLYSVTKLNLIPVGEHSAPRGQSPVGQFFNNIGVMWDDNKLQVAVLAGMVWTLLIWLLAAISLAISVLLYLLFLWHHIPSEDRGLGGYCRNKINRRMERVVKTKTDKALKKENELRAREEARLARDGVSIKKQPTLPDLGKANLDGLPPLSRQTTMTTLPEYTSRPNSNEALPPMPTPSAFRPTPKRLMTHQSDASFSSYNSNAPLINSAADMGYTPTIGAPTPSSATPGPTPGGWHNRPMASRNMTSDSSFGQRSFSPAPMRPSTAQGRPHTPGTYPLEPIPRSGTGMGGPPRRQMSNETPVSAYPNRDGSRTPSWERAANVADRRAPSPPSASSYFPPIPGSQNGRNSPAPGQGPPMRSYTPQGPPPRAYTPHGAPSLPRLQTSTSNDGGYRAFSPDLRSMTPASGAAPSFDNPPNFSRAPTGGRQTPQSNYPLDRPMPPYRQGTDGSRGSSNSGVDDILSHY